MTSATVPMLRDYGEADFASLGRLWEATGVGNPARGDSNEAILRTLRAGARLMVLDDGERVVGSVWCTDDARRMYVHHMAVLPECQGRGLSKLLMDEAVRFGAEKGLQMKLEVHRENARAIALYAKYGFDSLGDYEVMIRRKIG